jgi:hypothetical protein
MRDNNCSNVDRHQAEYWYILALVLGRGHDRCLCQCQNVLSPVEDAEEEQRHVVERSRGIMEDERNYSRPLVLELPRAACRAPSGVASPDLSKYSEEIVVL